MRVLVTAAAVSVLLAGCSDKGSDDLQYFNCGETPVKVQYDGAKASLSVDDAVYVLSHEGEGDYAAYTSTQDGQAVKFVPTDDGATLHINGQERPNCRAVRWQDNDDVTHFKAFGNEPGWTVEVSPALVQVMRGTDGKKLAQGRPVGEGLKKTYSFKNDKTKVSIKPATKAEPCRDVMSGQYFAYHVTLDMEGETYQGCGDGAPAYETNPRPLTGAVWVLEDIDGKGVVDRSNVNIRINSRGFINADTMCGRYAAEYTTEGADISFAEFKPIGSRMCRGEALREQQERFMDILKDVKHYAYQMDGGLVLSTKDEQVLLFRQR